MENLVEAMTFFPGDAPPVGVGFAIVLVLNAFHGVVVVDPGLADVVAHGFAEGRDGISSMRASLRAVSG